MLTSATAINENGDIVGAGLLNGELHRFLLPSGETPPAPNQPPVAVAVTSTTRGRAPLAVEFDATDSFDPDGDRAPLTLVVEEPDLQGTLAPDASSSVTYGAKLVHAPSPVAEGELPPCRFICHYPRACRRLRPTGRRSAR